MTMDTETRTPLRSCLYECRVMHHRLMPRQHRFEYGLFLACLDLDELDAISARLRLFGRNRRAVYEFRDADHFTRPGGPDSGPPVPGLRSAVVGWLAEQGVRVPAGARIRLVTLPRVAGYVFNPVSFYFVTDAAGHAICAVAEVGNTFGEQKPYLVPVESAATSGVFRLIAPKHFYVSPFSPLELQFDFRLRDPGEHLVIGVNDVDGEGRTVLISTLTGKRRPLTDGELVRLTLRYPLVTLRVIGLIHWEALRLWLKRIPFLRKSGQPELQRGRMTAPGHGLKPMPAPAPQAGRSL